MSEDKSWTIISKDQAPDDLTITARKMMDNFMNSPKVKAFTEAYFKQIGSEIAKYGTAISTFRYDDETNSFVIITPSSAKIEDMTGYVETKWMTKEELKKLY